MMLRVALLTGLLSFSWSIWGAASQQPAPTPASSTQQPHGQPQQHQQSTADDLRSSSNLPLTVQIVPSDNTQKISIEPTEEQKNHTSSDWWQIYITVPLCLATIILALYTGRLFSATRKMALQASKDSERQSQEMKDSNAASMRAAGAMEGVAASMAANLGLTRKIIKQQRRYSRLNMRAYLNVIGGGGLCESGRTRFELMTNILNNGNTPAHNVRWRIKTDILQAHIDRSVGLPLPSTWEGGNVIGPHQNFGIRTAVSEGVYFGDESVAIREGTGDRRVYTWGEISYVDAFKKLHTTKFFYWGQWVPVSGRPSELGVNAIFMDWHNEAD